MLCKNADPCERGRRYSRDGGRLREKERASVVKGRGRGEVPACSRGEKQNGPHARRSGGRGRVQVRDSRVKDGEGMEGEAPVMRGFTPRIINASSCSLTGPRPAAGYTEINVKRRTYLLASYPPGVRKILVYRVVTG